jgi:hypothetical protein
LVSFLSSKRGKLIEIIIIALITVSFLALFNCSGGGGADVTGGNGAGDGTPGITVNFTADLTTTESGGEATFKVVLNAQPSDNVTIDLISSDSGEGNISTASLTGIRNTT